MQTWMQKASTPWIKYRDHKTPPNSLHMPGPNTQGSPIHPFQPQPLLLYILSPVLLFPSRDFPMPSTSIHSSWKSHPAWHLRSLHQRSCHFPDPACRLLLRLVSSALGNHSIGAPQIKSSEYTRTLSNLGVFSTSFWKGRSCTSGRSSSFCSFVFSPGYFWSPDTNTLG